MEDLISQAAYARRRGVSRQAVSKAVKAGRITLVNGQVDPETADRDWEGNADPARGANAGARELVRDGGARGGVPTLKAAAGTQEGNDYSRARAEREQYLAKLARLEFEEREGSLIPRDAVKSAAFSAARRSRDLLLTMADRLAGDLEGKPLEERHRLIKAECQRACEELASIVPASPGA